MSVASASALSLAPLRARPASASDDSPEGFIAYAYAQRSQAMTTGETTLLDPLYDPASTDLLRFEKNRAQFMHGGLVASWSNSILLGYTSHVSLSDLQLTRSECTANLYEVTNISWISRLPGPVGLTQQDLERRRAEPSRFQRVGPLGARGEISSVIGTQHQVRLAKGTGWRLVADAYDDGLYASSPDLPPNSKIGGPGPSSSDIGPATVSMAPSSPYGSCAYDWSAAVSYAHAHAHSYNTGYCNYCNESCGCGGDCSNFVSQCLSAGNEHWNEQYWFCNPNHTCNCCNTPGVAWGGSLDWVNVTGLHDWITSKSGRGGDVGSLWSLGLGDIISYDWNVPDGTWDHVSIVTNFDGNGNPLISCHCYDHVDVVWWDYGTPGTNYRYTTIYGSYGC
ncbi:MAG: amidase domain-containing protein [Chloroflexota bacterium]